MKSLGNADPVLQRSLYKVLALSPNQRPSAESLHNHHQTQQELQNEPRGGEGHERPPELLVAPPFLCSAHFPHDLHSLGAFAS